MTNPHATDAPDDLDAALAALPRLVPSADLQARIMADAAAGQGAAWARPPIARRRRGPWQRLAGTFGGGGALAGMSFALMAGVLLGVTQPEPVAALTSVLLAGSAPDSVDLLPDGDLFWAEN